MSPNTQRDFEITRITRTNVLSLIDSLSYEQLICIPQGYSNSILWNFVHIAVTHQLLTYGLVGENCTLDEDLIDKFRKGSDGKNTITEKEFTSLKQNYLNLIDQVEAGYAHLSTKEFKTYSTSYNFTLHSLEEAIQFVNTHEGVHFGIMMAIKKLVHP